MENDIHPSKRPRIEPSSSPCSSPAIPSPPTASNLAPLPPEILLLSLPGLLAHPPNHPFHPQSLNLSLQALRQCLALHSLSPEAECRAWTQLAEVGMTVIDGGFNEDPSHAWAEGVVTEVSIYWHYCACPC